MLLAAAGAFLATSASAAPLLNQGNSIVQPTLTENVRLVTNMVAATGPVADAMLNVATMATPTLTDAAATPNPATATPNLATAAVITADPVLASVLVEDVIKACQNDFRPAGYESIAFQIPAATGSRSSAISLDRHGFQLRFQK
jgi:hypothetical protein